MKNNKEEYRCKECQDIRAKDLNRIASKERMKRYRERKKNEDVTVDKTVI